MRGLDAAFFFNKQWLFCYRVSVEVVPVTNDRLQEEVEIQFKVVLFRLSIVRFAGRYGDL